MRLFKAIIAAVFLIGSSVFPALAAEPNGKVQIKGGGPSVFSYEMSWGQDGQYQWAGKKISYWTANAIPSISIMETTHYAGSVIRTTTRSIGFNRMDPEVYDAEPGAQYRLLTHQLGIAGSGRNFVSSYWYPSACTTGPTFRLVVSYYRVHTLVENTTGQHMVLSYNRGRTWELLPMWDFNSYGKSIGQTNWGGELWVATAESSNQEYRCATLRWQGPYPY